jgi:hypothetical protein
LTPTFDGALTGLDKPIEVHLLLKGARRGHLEKELANYLVGLALTGRPRIGDGNVVPAKFLRPVGKCLPGPISWCPSGTFGLLNEGGHAIERASFAPPVPNCALAAALLLHPVSCRPHPFRLEAKAILPLPRSPDHGGTA